MEFSDKIDTALGSGKSVLPVDTVDRQDALETFSEAFSRLIGKLVVWGRYEAEVTEVYEGLSIGDWGSDKVTFAGALSIDVPEGTIWRVEDALSRELAADIEYSMLPTVKEVFGQNADLTVTCHISSGGVAIAVVPR